MLEDLFNQVAAREPMEGSSSSTVSGRDINARPIAAHLLLAAGCIAGQRLAALAQAREVVVDHLKISSDGGLAVA